MMLMQQSFVCFLMDFARFAETGFFDLVRIFIKIFIQSFRTGGRMTICDLR